MTLSVKDLSLVGASLYICEGGKMRIDNKGWKHYDVDFTNSDPRVIQIFLKFLRSNIPVVEERIKAQLFIYPDHSEVEIVRFWSKITQIPIGRFNKVIHLKQGSGRFKPSKYGTLKVRYHHKQHFLQIQDIISEVFGGVA